MNKIATLLVLLVLILSGCSRKKQKQEELVASMDSISTERIYAPSYYYIDKNNIIHTDNDCYSFSTVENVVHGIKRISKNTFIADPSYYYCTECVFPGDSIYTSILRTSNINQNKAKGIYYKSFIDSIGDYAYIESYNKNPLLHSVKDCPHIMDTIKEIKTNQLRGYRGDNIYPCCVFCVDSIIYQQIKSKNKKELPGWSLKTMPGIKVVTPTGKKAQKWNSNI